MDTGNRLWFAPFGQTPYWVKCYRTEKGLFTELPGLPGRAKVGYNLEVDGRDERALMAIDGWLLPGQPKHREDLILSKPIGLVRISEGRFRNTHGDCAASGAPHFGFVTADDKEMVIAEVPRHFLLLRAGNYSYATIDRRSFAIRYVFITVRSGGKNGWVVERKLVAGD